MKIDAGTVAVAVMMLLSSGSSSQAAGSAPPLRPVLALKGLDPVALISGKEVPGDPKFVVERGRFLYRFANADDKAEFEAKPARYEIQLRGQCAMYPGMMGAPDVFAVYEGRIYLGGNRHCLASFLKAPRTALRRHAERKKVAILVFEGVQIIDYTGPYEVFGQAGCDVFTVAERSDTLTTNMGMMIVPNFTLENCPHADIVVLPGGNVDPSLEHPAIIHWIKESADKATYVLSVCNGAFFLAKAGMLDGLTATTFHRLLDNLQREAPKCRVVSDQRFTDNGKIITSAGLSSGIDGALHVVEKMHGKGFAQQLALGIEYNWQPEARFARAKFADMNLIRAFGRGFDFPEPAVAKLYSTHGDADHWDKVWDIRNLAEADVRGIVDARLAKSWTKAAAKGSPDESASHWNFSDPHGGSWQGAASVQAVTGAEPMVRLTIHIERVRQ
jgi:putative intracellular protease/amidase